MQADFDNGDEEVDEVENDDDDDDDDDGANNNGDPPAGSSDKNSLDDDIDAQGCNGYRNVRIFMKGMLEDEDSLPYRDQVETVAKFCEQASLELQSRKSAALLDDRNDGGTVGANEGDCRPYLGPLNAPRLHKELSRQVSLISPRMTPSEALTHRTAFQD